MQTSDSNKKVLIITHYFPPNGGGGVIRMLKLGKYISSFGWDPIFLTADVNGLTIDTTLLDELPSNVKIVRTKPSIINNLKFRLLKTAFNSHSLPNKKVKKYPVLIYLVSVAVKFFEILKKPIESWVLLPDHQITWVHPAILIGKEILRENDVKAIISSGPPHSVHIVGEKLSQQFAIPWLIDFRDDWSDNPLFTPTSKYGQQYVKKMELRMVKNSAYVTTVSPPLRDKIAARFPKDWNNKFITIRNGFDPADFVGDVPDQNHTSELHLVYVGSYGASRTTAAMWSAFDRLKNEDPNSFSQIKIEFIGQFTDDKRKWQNMFSNQIVFTSTISHKEAVLRMRQADALFILLSAGEDGATAMPGKFYEYLAAKRPIVAFTCPGIMKDFIDRNQLGWAADLESSNDIFQTLNTILNSWRANGYLKYKGKVETINQFDRRIQAKSFATLLDSMSRNSYE